jgi:hypothetical protein
MNRVLAVLCLLFAFVYGYLGFVFTIDALFHDVVPNETAAVAIAAGGILLLIGGTVLIARSKRSYKLFRFLALAVALLALQVFAQEAARQEVKQREQVKWADVLAGVEVSEITDEVLNGPSGAPIGVRLSFTVETAQDVTLHIGPRLLVEKPRDRGAYLDLTPIRLRTAPPEQSGRRFYRRGERHRLTFDLVPSLLLWDPGVERYCLIHGEPRLVLRIKEGIERERGNLQPLIVILDGIDHRDRTRGSYDFGLFTSGILTGEIEPCNRLGPIEE